ncbi:GDSL-type esterase/lipase family protein [Nocardioides mangrovi]|uniref:GDSL-type esterase/lipase family protein n=1 Tax=Nocardioides mangrovi TaxID=2874580 RepID=A0ABS7U7H9_9ACTN|nr:GDSL-type esterase/lipase family protein [Nocardioides mangrovi]MBZ5736891.1 GDSL-type esterase/lipase family protein [Nocardioides mangrovi]
MIARLAGLLLVVALLTACGDDDRPVRVLIVGDSVTQGSAGDWTWRYRLWQHLEDDEVDVDFVGPTDKLAGPPPGETNEDYTDPDFDRDHAARWGKRFADPDWPIGDLVEAYHPDVVVELLGVNDLITGIAPDQVLDEAGDFVSDAQAADPGVDVVLGQLSQSWIAGVPAYDDGLAALAERGSTDDSRVVVAQAPADYVEDVDTWDPAHPSAQGEVKIAASVADALAGLGIGDDYPRPLPAVEPVPLESGELTGAPAPGAAVLTWTLPPGATTTIVWVRDVTTGEDWQRRPYGVAGTTFTDQGLPPGHTFDYRIQSGKGSQVSADYSNVVQVTPS